MAHRQHYESPFGDTTLTKVFVGGLAWETPTDLMRSYFEQFGEILEAVIINDKATGKSKGYGFVTFRDPESANRACADPNPVIGGRRANCNVASMGRTRPSPPRGRNRTGNSPYGPPSQPPPPPPSSAFRYAAYPPDYGYQQQAQYYNHLYGGAPYYYGPSYLYYPTTVEASSYAPPPRLSIPPSTEAGAGAPQTSTETETGPATSTSSTPE